jgi:hypothetical protein
MSQERGRDEAGLTEALDEFARAIAHAEKDTEAERAASAEQIRACADEYELMAVDVRYPTEVRVRAAELVSRARLLLIAAPPRPRWPSSIVGGLTLVALLGAGACAVASRVDARDQAERQQTCEAQCSADGHYHGVRAPGVCTCEWAAR